MKKSAGRELASCEISNLMSSKCDRICSNIYRLLFVVVDIDNPKQIDFYIGLYLASPPLACARVVEDESFHFVLG